MDVQWVKIKSWHALRTYDHFGPTTFCGRSAEGQVSVDVAPWNEKGCETCTRIIARRADEKAAD